MPKELITKIKKKKELKEISNKFVKETLDKYFQEKPKLISFLNNPKSAKYKKIIKEVRARLRRVYGLFRIEDQSKNRKDLVQKYLRQPNNKLLKEILLTHSSTKERLPFYKQLYQKLWGITGKPKRIIDLGSGVNPFSIPLMGLNKLEYYAYDLSKEETSLLNKFFKHLNQKNSNFNGKAEVLDINNITKVKDADVCFLFKMTDVLDKGKGHKTSEKIISKIPAKFVVVSFPTLTMSGKKMNFPRRKWIELMSKRLNYNFKVLEFSNEIFYVIKKG